MYEKKDFSLTKPLINDKLNDHNVSTPIINNIFQNEKHSSFKQIIRKIGLKVTTQRLAILKFLDQNSRHITIQEVYENLLQEHSNIGFATIYRFLKKLVDIGLVTETRIGKLPARYEFTNKNHHDHISCIRCKKIVEFESGEIEKLQKIIAEKYNFKLIDHILELYGICQECLKN